MTPNLQIRSCNLGNLRSFWRYPYAHYANHPTWVPPLRMDQKHKYSHKNPFFKHSKAAFWLAYDKGRPVGRIAAFVNQLHLEKYADHQGHFGCFEAKDQAVAIALLDTAAAWLQAQGMSHMVGPYDFSINEISGLLIDGFEKTPFIMMPYNTADYPLWFEQYGLQKAKDIFAYILDPHKELSETVQKFLVLSKRSFPVDVGPLDRRNLKAQLRHVFEIFNTAWTHNWGSIPLTSEEIADTVSAMAPIVIPEAGCFAYLREKPVGMLAAIPNINTLIRGYQGRLFPFHFLHLLFCLKTKKIPSFRVCLGGVIPEYVETKTSALIFMQLVAALLVQVRAHPQVKALELSWILEDNHNLISLIEAFGAQKDKVYRIYAMTFAQQS